MKKIIIIINLLLSLNLYAQDNTLKISDNNIIKLDSLQSNWVYNPKQRFVVNFTSRTPLEFSYENDSLNIVFDKNKLTETALNFLNYLIVNLRSDTIQKLNNKIREFEQRFDTTVFNPAPAPVYINPMSQDFLNLLKQTNFLIDSKRYKESLEKILELYGHIDIELAEVEKYYFIHELGLKLVKQLKK